MLSHANGSSPLTSLLPATSATTEGGGGGAMCAPLGAGGGGVTMTAMALTRQMHVMASFSYATDTCVSCVGSPCDMLEWYISPLPAFGITIATLNLCTWLTSVVKRLIIMRSQCKARVSGAIGCCDDEENDPSSDSRMMARILSAFEAFPVALVMLLTGHAVGRGRIRVPGCVLRAACSGLWCCVVYTGTGTEYRVLGLDRCAGRCTHNPQPTTQPHSYACRCAAEAAEQATERGKTEVF